MNRTDGRMKLGSEERTWRECDVDKVFYKSQRLIVDIMSFQVMAQYPTYTLAFLFQLRIKVQVCPRSSEKGGEDRLQ